MSGVNNFKMFHILVCGCQDWEINETVGFGCMVFIYVSNVSCGVLDCIIDRKTSVLEFILLIRVKCICYGCFLFLLEIFRLLGMPNIYTLFLLIHCSYCLIQSFVGVIKELNLSSLN